MHGSADVQIDVVSDADLQLLAAEPLRSMYTLSPFVWKTAEGFDILLRAVNRSAVAAEKVARIYHGRSPDGITFAMDDQPAIAPGPGEDDRDGCEDPTLAIEDGTHYVYYTGWNQTQLRGKLLLASGPNSRTLGKRGVAVDSSEACENPKEATIVQSGDGRWLLFFEFATHAASKIGFATSKHVCGPWAVQSRPFDLRPDKWDNWHLSTGPIVSGPDALPVMLYNGAGRDAKWRIGWIMFDKSYRSVVMRGADPIITPPPTSGDATDIAFAASALDMGDEMWLYYSISDMEMKRAVLRYR